ncbi:MAG: hypothetical protein ACR2FM_05065 [Candidatus Saccharimonadales bacterium]
MIYQNTSAIDAVNNNTATPDAFYHKSTLIATSKWVSTDGWRGYTEIVPVQGFKEIEADWLTGDWDDAPSGNSSSEVEAKIKQLEAEHGDIWAIFAPTSNVFSTAYSVIVRDPEARPLRGKTIGHKTKRYELPGGGWRVQYHATDVVTYDPDKQPHYTLNTGGWNTMTTSKRMTEALPGSWYVYRKNWVMYVHIPGLDDQEIKDGMEV